MFCLHSCDGCCCRTAETCCDSVAKVVHASGLVSVVDSVTTKITGISIFIFAAGLWFIKNQVGEFVHGHLSGSLHAGGAGFKDARADPNSSGPSALPSGPWPETPISLN